MKPHVCPKHCHLCPALDGLFVGCMGMAARGDCTCSPRFEERAGVDAHRSPFDALGRARVAQVRAILAALVEHWAPHPVADLDAVLALVSRERWTFAEIAKSDLDERVLDLARALAWAEAKAR